MVADQSVAPWPTNKQRRTCSPCLDILRDRIIGWCYINFTNLIWIKISAMSIRWTHIGDVTFKDWSCIADAAMPVLINSHLDRHENQRRTQCAYRRAEQCPAWMPFLCRYSSHSFWWVRTTASSWLLSACNALWCPPGDHNLHVVCALQIKQTILVSSSKRAELAETITFGVVLTSCIMLPGCRFVQQLRIQRPRTPWRRRRWHRRTIGEQCFLTPRCPKPYTTYWPNLQVY